MNTKYSYAWLGRGAFLWPMDTGARAIGLEEQYNSFVDTRNRRFRALNPIELIARQERQQLIGEADRRRNAPLDPVAVERLLEKRIKADPVQAYKLQEDVVSRAVKERSKKPYFEAENEKEASFVLNRIRSLFTL